MMTTATDTRNRQERRHPEETLPELATKKQVAEYLQVSQRQVELLTSKGRICKPIYLGESSPRWRRAELLASLGAAQEGDAEPYLPGRVIAEVRILRRLGHSLASVASNLGIDPEDLRTALNEPAWKEIPPDSESTNRDDEKPSPRVRHT